MSIIVEDATGLATAESYLSVLDYKSYWISRGVIVTESDTLLESNLRLATEYIDIRWGKRVIGLPISEDQALCFPTDYFITSPATLPISLQRATAEYVLWSISNNLFIDNDGSKGPGIKLLREKVGPIETETEWSGSGDGSIGRKYPIITKADSLMRQITIGSDQGSVFR